MLSGASQVVGKVATLAWTVLAARVLGAGDFGALFLALTVSMLVASVAQWGFEPVMSQEGSRHPGQLPALFTRAVTWQLVVAVPLFLVAGAVAELLWSSGQAVLWLLLLAMAFDIWSQTCRAASAAAQDQAGTSAALMAQRGITGALVVAALLGGGGVVAVAVAYTAGSGLGALVHARAVRRLGIAWVRSALTVPELRAMLHGTWFLGATSLALMALFRVDALLLGALADDDAVGAYAAAYRLLETVLFVVFAIRAALFPVMNVADDPVPPRQGVETGLSAIGLVYLPFAAVCLVETGPLLHLVYGSPYDDVSVGALRWLALAPLVYGLAYLQSAALQARALFPVMLAIATSAVAVNVALNLALIPAHAGTGAAAATTLSYAAACAAGAVVLRRDGVRPRILRSLAEPAAATAVLAALLLVLDLPLLVEGAVGIPVYVTAWLALSRRTNPGSLTLVRGLLRRGR